MFRGSMVALVTPFDDDTVDVERLRELVEFHIAHDTRALVVAGTTGEAGTLSHDEKCLVIKTVVEASAERIPVIAGTGMNGTRACAAFTQYAMDCGVHAALIMTPSYIKPTQEGLFQHYAYIAHEVGLPLILYNVPHRTGCDLMPETVGRLAAISNIIGLKEAVSTPERLHDVLTRVEGKLDVYSGDDVTASSWLLAGAKGVISVTANVAPQWIAQLCDAGFDQDVARCQALDMKLQPLNRALFQESNPIPVKWAMAHMGLIRHELRLPLTPLSESYHQPLKDALEALNLV